MNIASFLVLFLGYLSLYHAVDKTEPLLYPHTALLMPENCRLRQDCLGQRNDTWCTSGVRCVGKRCLVIPNYPCDRVQTCDADARVCVTKQCQYDRDCDDHLFCTGREVCLRTECVALKDEACTNGICSEKDKACSRPRPFREWGEFKEQYAADSLKIDGEVIREKITVLSYEAAHWDNSSNHTHNEGENNSMNAATIGAIVIGVIVLFILVIVVIIIANPTTQAMVVIQGGSTTIQ